ncbi:MAG TPA: DUF4190 domain-containing protein [Verrucomicrobiae bacterium]|jgi:hypothetical protein|nr:DUF4190 domain-containing protein [Verrucomicrobiae bacterium]
MYKVIGSDGKLYGPITAEVLRQWLAEGRVNQATLIQSEGSLDWRPLSTFASFAIPPAVAMPAPPAPVARPSNNLAVASLVCGLLGCICCCCGLPFALLGLVLSLVALMDAQERDRGLAVAGLILSILALGLHLIAPLLNLAALPWTMRMSRWHHF